MEKERSSKVIAIVALIVAVVGLSLGFASFATQLTINSKADVTADQSKFIVKFSTQSGSLATGTVEGTANPSEEGPTADTANLSETTVNDIHATFGKDTESVTYDFYVRNEGSIDAYLTGVNFAEASCTAKTEDTTNAELVQKACSNVKLTIKVNGQEYSDTDDNISGVKLVAGESATVQVKIETTAGATAADGDYTIDFGSITLDYNSKDIHA